ncbi:MAG: RNA polymerase factor sigma-54 [Clostridiales bacterium]|nr:RNA polymerase factor sigma-54 [Clostridiales bacterium]
MEIGFSPQLEQSQKLVMTPQLQQAIQILQFTPLELEEYINEQLEMNPILEKMEETVEDEYLLDIESEKDRIKGIDWKEYTEDFNNFEYTKGAYYNEGNEFNFENVVSKETTLQEHLLFQYNLTMADKKHIKIGEYIINSIDDRGYLMATVEEIAACFNQEQSIVENILQVIQTLDPPGVGARTLEECLLIQLRLLDIKDRKIYALVEKHLSDIASNRYPYIARQLGTTLKKVQGYCDFIKKLEPRPGRNFACSQNRYIIPDVIVRKIGKEYITLDNDYGGLGLVIRNDYKKMMASGDENSDVNKFLNAQFNSAVWLIKSIEQRKRTIHRVCETIVKKQSAFFENGRRYLKPMTLKEVADEIGIHESTVSRATNGKYMSTSFGMFELKYFFSGGFRKDSGEEISARNIKTFIKNIVNKEDCKKPLSDEKIANELKNKGINISRRTIAKYRSELDIPPSSKRKRYCI